MREYELLKLLVKENSDSRILYAKMRIFLIQEKTVHRNPVFSHILHSVPVNTQRHFNIYKTSMQRRQRRRNVL